MKIYTGNKAEGYTTTNNGITETTLSERNARRDGIIANDVPTSAKCCNNWESVPTTKRLPTWAKCCGWH